MVEEKALELFGSECVTGLASNNWKDRQGSLENISNTLKRLIPKDTPVQVIVRTVAAKNPGLKDANFTCLKQLIELISQLADQGYKFSQRSASYCLREIAGKLGDPKQSASAREAMSRIADHCTLAYACAQCMPAVLVQGKNPKNQETILVWITQAIKEFGLMELGFTSRKVLIAQLKEALLNRSLLVRSAAIQCIVTCNMYMPQLNRFFDEQKPILVKEITDQVKMVYKYEFSNNVILYWLRFLPS